MEREIDWRDDSGLKVATREFERDVSEFVCPDVVNGKDVWKVEIR